MQENRILLQLSNIQDQINIISEKLYNPQLTGSEVRELSKRRRSSRKTCLNYKDDWITLMNRNSFKRKQDKQKKREAANKKKLLKQRKALTEKKKTERDTAKMQRDIERLQNRVSGVTIRKPKEASS